MKWLCWIGFHRLGRPSWRFIGLDAFYWFRVCERCGKERKIESLGDPPARFIKGREIFDPQLVTREQRSAGVWSAKTEIVPIDQQGIGVTQ